VDENIMLQEGETKVTAEFGTAALSRASAVGHPFRQSASSSQIAQSRDWEWPRPWQCD